jgi:hypothetical protein
VCETTGTSLCRSHRLHGFRSGSTSCTNTGTPCGSTSCPAQ